MLEQLQANNLLCSRNATMTTQINGQPCTLTLAPFQSSLQPELTLTLRVEGVDTYLQLNKSFFSKITLVNTPIADTLDQLPEPLLMGSLHLIFERLLNDLRALLQKDIQLTNIKFTADPLPASLTINVTINEISYAGLISINTQNSAWIQSLPLSQTNNTLATLPVQVILEAGRTTVSSHHVSQLRSQDIIFFDQSWHKDNNHVFVKLCNNTGFLAQVDNQTVTLKNIMEASVSDDLDDLDDFDDIDDLDDDLDDLEDLIEESEKAVEETKSPTPAAKEDTPPAPTSAPDIDAIPIQLTFDLGQQDIPLGHMSQLAPGFTFQLNRPLASPVVINANGKPMAEGELVDVNGQLGARITKMI